MTTTKSLMLAGIAVMSLGIGDAMANTPSRYALAQGTWLSTHTEPANGCPATQLHLEVGPGLTLQGTVVVEAAKQYRTWFESGTYDSNGIFRLKGQELGSAETTSTLDAQVQSNGSLVMRLTDHSEPSPCFNRTVYLPWFRNGNDFEPNLAGGG